MTLEKAFALFDTDGDGKLTEEEVVAVLTRKTPTGTEFSELVARHKWRRWQREFDLNKDGKISYKELVDDMQAHPWKWGVSVGQLRRSSTTITTAKSASTSLPIRGRRLSEWAKMRMERSTPFFVRDRVHLALTARS